MASSESPSKRTIKSAPPPSSHDTLGAKHSMDSGYSWLVLIGSFLISLIILGQVLNFGIYYVVFLEYFHASRKATSLTGALCYALMCLCGPVAGGLQKRYGARLVITSGALLATLGLALSYLATELWHLWLTYGCLCGLGYGLCVTPSLGVLPEYFDKYRYFATSFVAIGAGLGSWIFAPLSLYLIETYTWRGSMLVQAGLCLQLLVFGVICKSRIVHPRMSLGSLFDVKIFKDIRFVFLFLDGIVLGGASFTVFSMINSLIIDRGLTTWQSAQLVSVAGIANTLARVIISFATQAKCTDRTLLYSLMTLTTAAGIVACVFAYDYWSFAVSMAIFGFSLGIKFSQPPNVIIDLFGVGKVVTGIGYYMFSIGLGGFVLPLFAGWLADQTETQYAFVMMAINCLIGFGFCALLLIMRRRRSRKDEKKDKEEEEMEAMGQGELARAISID